MKTIKIFILFVFLFCLVPYISIAQDENIDSIISSTYQGFDTIGTLTISKINLSLPILSKTTTKSLDVSVCRFHNQIMPNEFGNLVIART